jgi:hypothetical protein
MQYRGADGRIIIHEDSIYLVRLNMSDEDIKKRLSQVKPIKIKGFHSQKPKLALPGFVALIEEENTANPKDWILFYEHPLTLHIDSKPMWKEFEFFEAKLNEIFVKNSTVDLFHFNPLDFPAEKVKRTSIPNGWDESYRIIHDALVSANKEDYVQIEVVLASDDPGPVILGQWRGEDRLFLVVLYEESQLQANLDELAEAGWHLQNETADTYGLNGEFSWTVSEAPHIAKMLVNTLKWCFGLDPASFYIRTVR